MFSEARVIPSVHIGGGCWLPSVNHRSHDQGGSASGGLGRPPPPEHYGIRSISGRYASYWNAFLFVWGFFAADI